MRVRPLIHRSSSGAVNDDTTMPTMIAAPMRVKSPSSPYGDDHEHRTAGLHDVAPEAEHRAEQDHQQRGVADEGADELPEPEPALSEARTGVRG